MSAKHEDRSQTRGAAAPAAGRTSSVGRDLSEQRAAMADTLPPMPLRELLSAGGANLFVLSVDPELIETVQRAGGEQYPVFPVQTWAELEAAVESRRCGIALLDTDLLGASLAGRITALQRAADRVVTLVAADRAVAQELMGYLSDRRIHRLLIKPPAFGITRLLIESAVNRCLQLRDSAGAEAAAMEAAPPSKATRRGRRTPLWVLVTAGAALLVGVTVAAVIGGWRQTERPLAAVQSPEREALDESVAAAFDTDARADEGSQRFAELLARAETAFREGRLAAPAGDSALDYYLTILAADPAEETARERVALIVDALFARAEDALLAESLDDAAAALVSVRRADPMSGRLAFLETQLERARAAVEAPRSAPPVAAVAPPVAVAATVAPRQAASPAPSSELASLLTIATARLRRGQLLEPAGDSASEYLDRAALIDAGDPRVTALRGQLAAATAAAARGALASADLVAAKRLTEEARRLGAEREALALLELELSSAQEVAVQQRHDEWLAVARARLASGALIAPADDSALHYLAKLQSEAPGFRGLDTSWTQLAEALATNTRAALVARNWVSADGLLRALDTVPRGAMIGAPLRTELEALRLQEQYLAVAAPASELALQHLVPAVYPAEAQRRGLEGWVELEFVVDRSGVPKSLAVAQAEPAGRFDEAALKAVAQYRYTPFERAGRVYERRVRLRVRFTLQ